MASMMRHDRAFWEKTVQTFEQSGATHAVFAHRMGVTVGALRHWLYKLRREGSFRSESTSVRLVPVEVTGASGAELVEVGVGGAVVRFRVGTDVSSPSAR